MSLPFGEFRLQLLDQGIQHHGHLVVEASSFLPRIAQEFVPELEGVRMNLMPSEPGGTQDRLLQIIDDVAVQFHRAILSDCAVQ